MRERGTLIRLALGACIATAWLALPSAASAGTINVTQFNDAYNDGGTGGTVCSIREAITAAQTDGTFNACDAGSDDNLDVIRVPSNNTITLDIAGSGDNTNATGDLDIIGNIGGVAGDDQLTIQSSTAGQPATINQNVGDRILEARTMSISQQLSALTLTDLVITDGVAPAGTSGGGLLLPGFTVATLNNVRVTNNSADALSAGGGLRSGGAITINSSRFDNNSAGFAGGAWFEGPGLVNINRTTFDNNNATDGNAGGLAVGGNGPTVTVRNSTITGNKAVGAGGGITQSATSTLTLSNSTVAANTADFGEAGGTDDGGGIAIFSGTLNASNTIVADNVDVSGGAPDCSGSITSQGYNLIESTAGCTFTNNNDIVGQDPKLNSLQGATVGGWTYWRMPLLSGSPAFNAGNPATPDGSPPECETIDQEGTTRPYDGTGTDRCDIGAVEQFAGDADGDKHFDGLDNCTSVANPGQENYDADSLGDACDTDDDNDGRLDGVDNCDPPTASDLGWTSNGTTDYDSDGCQDSSEDTDDDNDTVPDTTETGCPTSSGPGLPKDTDSDDDGTLDAPDDFPCNAAEATDTDSDGVGNNADNCDAVANPGQQNNDGDTEGDACDADDDNDGVADTSDGCPTQANATSNGCPAPAVAGPTGQRAAALKKCKKKKTATARKKCKKKANKLPL